MDESKIIVEDAIDMHYIVLKVVMTWKMWIFLSIFCGGLLMAGMHIHQIKANKKVEPQTESSMKASLSKEEIVAVEDAVEENEDIQAQKSYLANSMLMNTELLNEKKIVVTYRVDSKSESDCNEKKTIVLQQLTSDSFLEGLASAYPKKENQFIREMLSVDASMTSTTYNPMIILTCIETKDTNTELLKQNIISTINQIQKDTGIELVNTGISEKTIADQETVSLRQQLNNELSTNKTALAAKVTEFTIQQQALYQYEIQPSNKKNIAQNATAQATVGWSKKYFAIGFIGFAFLWFLLLIVKDIWHRPVETVMDALNAEHKKCLGQIVREEKTGRWHRIVYDPFLEKKLSPKKEPIDLQYEKLLESIALNLKAEQKSEMLMVQMGTLDTEGRKLIQKLQQDLNDRQLTLTCIEPEVLEQEWLRRKEQKKETLLVMNLTGKTVSHASYLAIQNMLLTRGRELFGIMAV